MFFSKEQIEQSTKRLDGLNPFFGITFLALKKAELPIGTMKRMDFLQIVDEFLRLYYHPRPKHQGFYTPFKTSSKSKHWNTTLYKNTLRQIAIDNFSDVLSSSDENRNWGWKSDYVDKLEKKHLKSRIPAFDLAVWLFRSRQWEDKVQGIDIVEALLSDFHITSEERSLFDISIPSLADQWLQPQEVTREELLDIIDELEGEEGAILKQLKLNDVGPAKQIECKFAPRINIITGDNGLGKTFLLECAWWALTGTWAGKYPAYPQQDDDNSSPYIAFQIGQKKQSEKVQIAKYEWKYQRWENPVKQKLLPGLSIFSQSDSSFTVWDPAKHLLAEENPQYAGRNSDALIHLSRTEIWDGVRENHDGILRIPCEGLIHDWVYWQNADKARFEQFSNALKKLSPHSMKEPLIPGQPRRVTPSDTRMIPTLKFPYGEVPITLCSAGIQRIVALAYLLVWAWNEHTVTSKSTRRDPRRSIVLLIDEMEAHLHPFWQRTIVPALIDVVRVLSIEVQVQIILATHSPLVLASAEPLFDDDRDALFHLYIDDNGAVQLDNVPFIKRGGVDKWLMSEVFGLKLPRSIEAEEAIEAAKELQRKRTPSTEEVQKVSDKLVNVLAQDDDFWPRWTYFAEQRGVSL